MHVHGGTCRRCIGAPAACSPAAANVDAAAGTRRLPRPPPKSPQRLRPWSCQESPRSTVRRCRRSAGAGCCQLSRTCSRRRCRSWRRARRPPGCRWSPNPTSGAGRRACSTCGAHCVARWVRGAGWRSGIACLRDHLAFFRPIWGWATVFSSARIPTCASPCPHAALRHAAGSA